MARPQVSIPVNRPVLLIPLKSKLESLKVVQVQLKADHKEGHQANKRVVQEVDQEAMGKEDQEAI